MKILHAGNTANVGYQTTKQLRKNGIESELLLESSGMNKLTNIDPDLNNEYPNWVFFFNKKKHFWKMKIIRTMRDKKYDLIHTYGELPIFAYFSGKPFVVQALGSDFREKAVSNSLIGLLLRRAYKKAKIILFSMPDHIPIYHKLGLKNGIFLPLIVNSNFFKPLNLERTEYTDELVVLHATNLEWRLKRNDILIKGFAEFVKSNPHSRLIIIDRGVDSEKTQQLVKSLELAKKVKYIKGPLNSTEMRHYYNLADVVADAFLLPAMSNTTNESLCCEKPVIAYYPKEESEGVYPEHPPILNALTPSEVRQKLEILVDTKKRIEIGKKSRLWILKYNNPDFYSTKLNIIYQSVLNGDNIEGICENLSRVTHLKKID